MWLLILILVLVLRALRSCRERCCQPRVLAGPQMSAILAHCGSLFRRLRLTPWALSGHIQATLYAFWPQVGWHGSLRPQYFREMVRCRDGGHVALDWICFDDKIPREDTEDTIIIHVPGFVGKSTDTYACRMAQYLHGQTGGHMRSVVKSWRGIHCPLSKESLRPETWDVFAARDVLDVAEKLRARFPRAGLALVGWSHGGNVALATLALAGAAEGLFMAGLVVSAPTDMAAAFAFVEGKQWFPYSFVNAHSLIQDYAASGARATIAKSLEGGSAKMRVMDHILSKKNLVMHPLVRRPYASIWHDMVTRQYTGHATLDAYYKSLTHMVEEALPQITTPTLCLLSEDDPVTPMSTYRKFLPSGGAQSSPWVAFSLTKRGGHCGWFCGIRGLSWVDDVAVEFFEACGRRLSVSV